MNCDVFLRHDVLISYCARNMGPWDESTEVYSFTCPFDNERYKLKIYKTQGREHGRCINCSKQCSIYDIASAYLGMDKIKDFRKIVEHISTEVNIPLHDAWWKEVDLRKVKTSDQHRQAHLPRKKEEELICAVQRTAGSPEQQKAIDQELPLSHTTSCTKENFMTNKKSYAVGGQLLSNKAEQYAHEVKNVNHENNMHKHHDINSTEVLVTWKDKLASHPNQVPVALMLSIYCREKLNGGILENAREFLNNENQRNQLGLKIGDSEMLLHEQSPFWHWEQDSLHVDFYDLHSEERHLRKQKMAKRSAVAALRNKRYSEKRRNQNLVK